MKLLARIFRQKGGQVNSYTLYLWNNAGKGCLCILMSYITWPTLAYLIICFYFLLMIPHIFYIGVVYEFRVLSRYCNFSILAWSLKMKRDDLHMQNGLPELKKFSVRFEEKIYTTATYQSGICLMRGSIITILSRHEYTHAFMLVQMCV